MFRSAAHSVYTAKSRRADLPLVSATEHQWGIGEGIGQYLLVEKGCLSPLLCTGGGGVLLSELDIIFSAHVGCKGGKYYCVACDGDIRISCCGVP